MPALPHLFGVLSLPSGAVAIMSDKAGGTQSKVRVGDSVGEFKIAKLDNQHITLLTGIRMVFDRHDRVGIPTKKTTGSDAWRPSIPIDDDQGAQVRGGTVGCIC